MFDIKVTFDRLDRKLERLAENVRKLDGALQLSLSELLTPAFMQANTQFFSLDEMLKGSPFEVHSAEDFKTIPVDQWDNYVWATTDFPTWRDMLHGAVVEKLRRDPLLLGQ